MSGKRNYLALLVTLLFLIVFYPMLRGPAAGRLVYDALLAAALLGSLVAVFPARRRLLAALLGVPTLAGLWTGYSLPGLARVPVLVAFHAAAALFLTFSVVTVLQDVHGRERVDANGVHGAMCGYLLVGLTFAHLYCLLEAAAPGSFRGVEEAAGAGDDGRVHFQLAYFSFATLTTVGYGDVAPAQPGARGLAVVEAMLGQFYVAVLLGELIGKKVAHALAEKEDGAKGRE